MKKKYLVLFAFFMVITLCSSSNATIVWASGYSEKSENKVHRLNTSDSNLIGSDASSDIQALIDRIYQCDTGFPNDMTSEEVSRLLNDGGESARKALRFAAAHSQPVPNPMDGMMAPSSDAEALHDDRKSTSQTESKVCYDFRTGETTIEVNGEKETVPKDYCIQQSRLEFHQANP